MDRYFSQKTKATIFLTACFFLISCGGSDSPTEPVTQEVVLASGTINESGGSLDHADIGLDIPAGAFTESHEVSLVLLDLTYPGNPARSGFRIDGLPDQWQQPLKIRIPDPSAGNKGDVPDPVFYVGEEAFAGSLNRMETIYHQFELSSQEGSWIITIPIVDDADAQTSRAKDGTTTSLTVQRGGIADFAVSNEGHFRLHWAIGSVTAEDATAMAGFLEEAYSYYLDLGFDYSRRTTWPVSVAILPLEDEAFGFYMNSMLGDNSGYIQLNLLHISDWEEMRTTCGHEFFHMVQSFYDNRWAYFQSKRMPPHHWLNEATAVWAENHFSDDSAYESVIRQGNFSTPYDGLETADAEIAGLHGYGLAALIRYLVRENGTSFLPEIYHQIRDGKNGTGAIDEVIGNIESWWGDFLRDYTAGELHPPIEMGQLIGSREGQFTIAGPDDNNWSMTLDYNDLSGKFFGVQISDVTLTSDASLTLSVTGESSEIHVFSYGAAGLSWLISGSSEVSVNGLLTLMNSNSRLLVLVTQGRAVSPYNTTAPITISGSVNRITADLSGFTDVYARWSFDVQQLFGDGSTGQTVIASTDFHATNLVINGTDFSCSVDQVTDWFGYERHFYGTVNATLSEDLSRIIQVTAEISMDNIFDGQDPVPVYHSTVSAGGLPMVSYYPGFSASWKLLNDDACAGTTEMQYDYYQNDWVSTGYSCEEPSYNYVEISIQ